MRDKEVFFRGISVIWLSPSSSAVLRCESGHVNTRRLRTRHACRVYGSIQDGYMTTCQTCPVWDVRLDKRIINVLTTGLKFAGIKLKMMKGNTKFWTDVLQLGCIVFPAHSDDVIQPCLVERKATKAADNQNAVSIVSELQVATKYLLLPLSSFAVRMVEAPRWLVFSGTLINTLHFLEFKLI